METNSVLIKPKNKLCVYTFNFGCHDTLKEIPLEYIEPNIDYYYFTDSHKINPKTWKVIYYDVDNNINKTESRRKAKRTKILMPDIIRQYEKSISIDASINIKDKLSPYFDLVSPQVPFGVFKHRFRNCIYDEIDTIVRLDLKKICISLDKMLEHKQKYLDDSYPRNNGLIESGFLIRQNKESLPLCEAWISDCLECGRDQTSFNYYAWKTGTKLNVRPAPIPFV